MTLRQSFTVSLVVFIILLGSVFSPTSLLLGNENNPPLNKGGQGSVSGESGKLEKIKGTIVITSKTLSSDNKAHTVLFEGSVIAKTENMTLYSDRMLVIYAEQTGNVTRIDAEGSVKLVRNDLLITSQAANYFADEEKVVFTGEPKAVEKGNVVTGTKMTYLLKDDRSIVENSRALLENKKGK